MLLDPDRIHHGPSADDTRSLLTWVDDTTLADPTDHWTLGHDADAPTDAFQLTNHHPTDGDTTPLEVRPDGEVRASTIAVTDRVTQPLHLAGTTTRISGFDADNRHWIHADDAGNDTALALEQHGTGDYSLVVSEGDETNDALTQGDEGSLDAGTLDGKASSGYVQADGSVGLTADLPADDHGIAFTDGRVATDTNGHLTLTATGDVRADSPLYQQGNRVLDTSDAVGVDAENTDGTPLVADADAITAGTDLSFTDDGDQTATLSFVGDTSPASAAVGDHVTASGDGSTTQFTLAHSLGVTPDAPAVVPASRPASTDFEVTGVDANAVTIEYATAPPSGTDNLEWYVITTASGLDAVTVSDDDATAVANPQDLNLGDGLTATDDGDQTATLDVDGTVARTDTAEHFDAGVGVGADSDLAFTNASQTTQFAFAYDSTNDQHVWADRANAATVATVDRTQTVAFVQRPTVAGTGVATLDDVSDGGGGTATTSVTVSGDGTTTTFALSHGLDVAPSGAFVQERSKAAMSDFRVTNKTQSGVVIQYHSAPPEGTDNLQYDVIVHA